MHLQSPSFLLLSALLVCHPLCGWLWERHAGRVCLSTACLFGNQHRGCAEVLDIRGVVHATMCRHCFTAYMASERSCPMHTHIYAHLPVCVCNTLWRCLLQLNSTL